MELVHSDGHGALMILPHIKGERQENRRMLIWIVNN
jgi:hypothetical protein